MAVDAGGFDGQPGGFGQGLHVVGVALGGVVRIFLLAEERVSARTRAQAPLGAIEYRYANAESAEIDTGDDTHEVLQDLAHALVRAASPLLGTPGGNGAKNGMADRLAPACLLGNPVTGDGIPPGRHIGLSDFAARNFIPSHRVAY